VAQLQRLYETTDSEFSRQRVRQYMSRHLCTACAGARLKPEILAVTVASDLRGELNIHAFCQQTIGEALDFIQGLEVNEQERFITSEVRREIANRLSFLTEVGLGYLSLDRESGTLSGGEAQRIRLATQIGSGLAGCLYVLDEPSIGLHQRDNDRLIGTLQRLRDLGNSVIVVEHDEDTIRAADHVLDLGPGAGVRGGHLVAQGSVEEIIAVEGSLTGQYLSGRARIPVPRSRRAPSKPKKLGGERQHDDGWLTIRDATENNLQHVTASFPLGCFTCVSGVSGSGKSTLVDDILRRTLFRHFPSIEGSARKHAGLLGLEQIDKAIVIEPAAPTQPTPAAAPAADAAATPTAATFAEGATIVTTDDVNLRASASTDAAIVAVLGAGVPLEVTGATVDGWVPVRDPSTGRRGYVTLDFVAEG
jgi:excinuclease ABC subunit A